MVAKTDPGIFVNQNGRLRLEFLDGVRGLAALYVVLYHVYVKMAIDRSLWGAGQPQMPWYAAWLNYGRWSVDVFIVLSGFCLMLPVVRSSSRRIEGGLRAFFQRRAIRILPPYYAALVLSMALLAIGPILDKYARHHGNSGADFRLPVVLSHLFLLQNLNSVWAGSINAPMWSVATEWQIYFLFPLLLLPIWRRYGNAAAISAGVAVGVAPHLLHCVWLDNTRPWLLGLFAMGMAGAALSFPVNDVAPIVWNRRSMAIVVTGLVSAVLAVGIWLPKWPNQFGWQIDCVVGLTTLALLVHSTRSLNENESARKPLFYRLTDSRWPVSLGKFSYSLYLTHSPLLAILYFLVRRLGLGVSLTFNIMIAVGVPLALIAAHFFYLRFERPFLKQRKQSLPESVRLAPAEALIN